MQFSKFGSKFSGGTSGILQLMDDLGRALASGEEVIMLGGGNPAHIPAVQERLRERMQRILAERGAFERMIGNYATPQGDVAFIKALADLLNREYDWRLTPANIALVNGSQTAFFFLFNLFAGEFADGTRKKILLPLAPEYIGYVDVGLTEDFFVASRPEIEYLDAHTFKYHVDFDTLTVTEEIGAICVSRPTNPTGNVLTDAEIEKLRRLAHQHDIPLIIDNAYGTPFPHIVFTDVQPVWDDHVILCMSLSKLGLPAARTGIIIANEEVITAVCGMNAIISLAPGSLGAILALDLVRSGEIIYMSREVIQPYYQRKAEQAMAWLWEELRDLEFYIHKPEGSFFLWLWFPELPITCQELYERLKARRVLVVPGYHFFPGLREEWRHRQECIRMTYAQDEETVHKGIRIIAEEVRRAYGGF